MPQPQELCIPSHAPGGWGSPASGKGACALPVSWIPLCTLAGRSGGLLTKWLQVSVPVPDWTPVRAHSSCLGHNLEADSSAFILLIPPLGPDPTSLKQLGACSFLLETGSWGENTSCGTFCLNLGWLELKEAGSWEAKQHLGDTETWLALCLAL